MENKKEKNEALTDIIYRLQEGKKMEERVHSNYMEILKFLSEPDDIDEILAIIKDEERHVKMVAGVIEILKKKIEA